MNNSKKVYVNILVKNVILILKKIGGYVSYLMKFKKNIYAPTFFLNLFYL